jgi:flagellar biosynthetic protein FliR
MIDSFKLVPLGTVAFQLSGAADLVRLSAGVFVLAVKIASPVMLALFLTDAALGIVARTVPQMNVFIVGFPLKIAIGLFAVGLTLPVFAYVFQGSVTRLQDSLSSLIISMAR